MLSYNIKEITAISICKGIHAMCSVLQYIAVASNQCDEVRKSKCSVLSVLPV